MRKIFFVLLFFTTLFSFSSVYASTETVRIYSHPSDGRFILGDSFERINWDQARNYSPYPADPNTDQDILNVRSDNKSGFYRIYRGSIPFDTSIIPSEAEIVEASLNTFAETGNNTGVEIVITQHNRASSTHLSASDWEIENFGAKGFARGSLNTTGKTKFVLSSDFEDSLNKDGYTILGILTAFDFDNINPGSSIRAASFYSSEAPGTSTDPYLEITYTVEDPEPEVDGLVMQYAPRLFMHEDENYDPMNIEAFVDASALWNRDSGLQVADASSFDIGALEDLVESGENTSGYYMAFSEPDEAGSIDPGSARTIYEQLVDSEAATSTIYYHKTDATAADGREFTVLQYWFFYAMNDWKENGGVNNHEGDWESVFVFLDADSEEPEYVAFSSHLNDGDVTPINGQYLSVLRRWNSAVETDGDRVRTYVALGSHANYPKDNVHQLADMTSDDGDIVEDAVLRNIDPLAWSDYAGLWGTFVDTLGFAGPQGPKFIDVTSQTRYYNPIGWAGIDNTKSFVASFGQRSFEAADQHAAIEFEQPIEVGTKITVDLHKEIIRFGKNLHKINLLPDFWDIVTDLPGNAFRAILRLEYDQSMVAAVGGWEEQLGIYYYNETTDEWELQPTVVDVEGRTVTTEVDHFSWYAIGLIPDDVYLESLFDQIIAVVDGSELAAPHKRNLIAQAERLRGVVDESDRRSLNAKKQLLSVFLNIADNKKYRDGLTEDELSDLELLIGRVVDMLE